MKLKITLHGVAYEVNVEVLDAGDGFYQAGRASHRREASEPSPEPLPDTPSAPRRREDETENPTAGGSVNSPIAGTVISIKCKEGDLVEKGAELIVLEAMKMEASIAAPLSGRIRSVEVAVGDSIREGQEVIRYE